jgi:alcohol dehydrogenase
MDIRVVSGPGSFDQVGALAEELALTRVLVVSDKGIVAAGLPDLAVTRLRELGIAAWVFDAFTPSPDTRMVEAGRAFAADHRIDGIVALGGGSSLDCAKGINLLLTNGGSMSDYRGHHRVTRPTLPSIGVPTTAGTGSEARSAAIISDPETHARMTCGDANTAFRVVILDAELTATQPREVAAAAGYDAISHAVEAFVTRTRTAASQQAAQQAWRLLEQSYERVLAEPGDIAARDSMLLGANRAGAAIEMSMLGAAHACANALTARYGIGHGVAIAVMLPHVVRWNSEVAGAEYAPLFDGDLPARLDSLARAGGLPRTLREIGVESGDCDALAADAATQWTGQHNPRPFGAADARLLYERAL